MTRRAAILGLGERGARWAEACHRSGWIVRGFDPEPEAGRDLGTLTDMRREATISSSVAGADWVICCLPERLELMQMVIQRAQAEAPRSAIIAVVSQDFDIVEIQSCAIRPGQLFRLTESEDGGLALDVTERNTPEVRILARESFAELSAVLSLPMDAGDADYGDAESA